MCTWRHRSLGSAAAQSCGRFSCFHFNLTTTITAVAITVVIINIFLSVSCVVLFNIVFDDTSGLFPGGRRGHGRGPLRRLHLALPNHPRIAGLSAPCCRRTRHQRPAATTGTAGRLEGGATGTRAGRRAHLCVLQVAHKPRQNLFV